MMHEQRTAVGGEDTATVGDVHYVSPISECLNRWLSYDTVWKKIITAMVHGDTRVGAFARSLSGTGWPRAKYLRRSRVVRGQGEPGASASASASSQGR